MRTVWITRAPPGAHATAARVAALGFAPFVAPLIRTRPTGEGGLDLGGPCGALAFTSGNGVRAFRDRSKVRDLPVFAVGAATARAARAAGFEAVHSAEGDVVALAAFIQAAPKPAGPIIHAAAAEPAGDLVGALTAMGIPARRLEVYETLEVEMAGETLADCLGADLILLHSPRAAAVLARIMAGQAACQPNVLCLSAAVAAPLKDVRLGGLTIAAAPHEESLMERLEAWGGSL